MNIIKSILKIYFISFIFFASYFSFRIVYADSVNINVNSSRFIFSTNKPIELSVFILENPSRLVIDFENIDKFIKNNID